MTIEIRPVSGRGANWKVVRTDRFSIFDDVDPDFINRTFQTQDAAIARARREAEPGERITLTKQTGGRRVIREGN